jgi:sensor histidine kinase YesM
MPTINLSRIIGIILDNAIEASEKIEDDPLIRIAFIKSFLGKGYELLAYLVRIYS